MLNGTLALHDIDDVEKLCGYVIERSGLELSFHEREELLTHLIEATWDLSRRYEPGIIRKGFSLWATTTLRRRVIDWQRRDGGRTRWQFADRTYERDLPKFIALDDEVPGSLLGPDLGSDAFRRLVRKRGRLRARHLDDLREAMRERTAA